MKGLSSRAFLKIPLLADFDYFMEIPLNFIPLPQDLIFDSNNISLVLFYIKIVIIMPCYDSIVKFERASLEGLFWPFLKRDEPKIDSNDDK